VSKVDLRLQCGMPCSKLEVSTAQHGTLSGAGYLHQSHTEAFFKELRERATRLARQPEHRLNLRRKHERRVDDESAKPLASYRAEELQRMWVNFFGPDPAYHEARRRFVFKGNAPPRPNNSTVEVEVTQTSWVHSQRYLSNSIGSQLAVG
jgi:hypothetical protein